MRRGHVGAYNGINRPPARPMTHRSHAQMAGAFSTLDGSGSMPKTWLSLQEQVAQLHCRGLIIDDDEACLRFLSQVSYYRFSGYFRYWQRSPETGDNRFVKGANFSAIREAYETEQAVATLAFEAIQKLEILLRTTFAHHYAQYTSPEGALTRGMELTQPPTQMRNRSKSTYFAILIEVKKPTSLTTATSRRRTCRASTRRRHTTTCPCGQYPKRCHSEHSRGASRHAAEHRSLIISPHP
ncbi:hypothetical protein CWT12_11610 [Actinomyces sp. 432]|nr:hypothetical protein CWT12_11610 [Actinomyces sp. 432]